LQKQGWRDASTFAAFCDKHDAALFKPLEGAPFSGSKKQIFLIAYRAICWELYQKQTVEKAKATRHELLDRGAHDDAQKTIQLMLSAQDLGIRKALDVLMAAKGNMDKSLLVDDYRPFATYEIQLDGPLAIAATGGITPNLSIGGVRLQDLMDLRAQTQWLCFGVDISDAGPTAVFLWRADDSAPSRYMAELKALSDPQLAEFLAQFFFVHCENTYFASSWWDTLDRAQQAFLVRLAANFEPYSFPPKYEWDRAVAPWKVASRRSA
jgi:hypothetical protein